MEQKQNRSENLNELFTALAKAQSEMEVAGLTSSNPFFKSKYADFATIVRASRSTLTKHGLCVIQQIISNPEGASILHTILGHSSGQYIETQIKLVPAKQDIQSWGSCLTYLKRYTYAAIIGLACGDEDDDGNAAASQPRQQKYESVAEDIEEEVILASEEEMLQDHLAGNPEIAQDILKRLGITKLADMPRSKYKAALNHVIKTKNMLGK